MTTRCTTAARTAEPHGRGWWGGLEDEVLGCLASSGAASPADIAKRVGMSERAVCSVLAMLATDGKIRISRIELAPEHAA